MAEPAHRGCHNTKPVQCSVQEKGQFFGFHTAPSCYLCTACQTGAPWGHTPLSPPIKVQTCHQDGRRAGAKCAALAGRSAILNSLPSPTHLETKVVGKRGPLPAPSTVARSGGHHHDFA